MVKRIRVKKQQKETEKQQHIFMTDNNLFKGFTTKGDRPKQSTALQPKAVWKA